MFLKEEDNSDYDDDLFYFTLATPFLEKDDEHITFTDMSNAASTSSRKPAKSSRSDSQVSSFCASLTLRFNSLIYNLTK